MEFFAHACPGLALDRARLHPDAFAMLKMAPYACISVRHASGGAGLSAGPVRAAPLIAIPDAYAAPGDVLVPVWLKGALGVGGDGTGDKVEVVAVDAACRMASDDGLSEESGVVKSLTLQMLAGTVADAMSTSDRLPRSPSSALLKRKLCGMRLLEGDVVALRCCGSVRLALVRDMDPPSDRAMCSATTRVAMLPGAVDPRVDAIRRKELPASRAAPLLRAASLAMKAAGSKGGRGRRHVSTGVLLHGPGGAGKTWLAEHAAAAQTGASTLRVSCASILMEARSGRTVRGGLASLAGAASGNSVLILDDMHMLSTAPPELVALVGRSVRRRLVSPSSCCCVIGITTDPVLVPAAFSSLFGHQVHLTAPRTREERVELIESIVSAHTHPSFSLSGVAEELAGARAGFLPRDVVAAVRAALRLGPLHSSPSKAPARAFKARLSDALKSEMRLSAAPSVETDSTAPSAAVAGYAALRGRLDRLVNEWWVRADLYERLQISPFKGLLLHGPSGCGKTLLVQRLAADSPLNFMQVRASDISSAYLGESERALRAVFQAARDAAPCLLFIDELDAIAEARNFDDSGGGGSGVGARLLSTLLNELDGVEGRQGVLVVSATNRLQAVDAALRRPGRFDALVEVGPPDVTDRLEIVAAHVKPLSVAKDVSLPDIASVFKPGHTGADIAQCCRKAALLAMREVVETGATPEVAMRHFSEAHARLL